MRRNDIEDVYELSPLQQGMLLHSWFGGDPDTYVAQRSYLIDGPVQPDRLRQAWQHTVAAHTALRTSYHWEDLDAPLQVVHRELPVPMPHYDWSALHETTQREQFACLLASDRASGFDLTRGPLTRLHLVQFGPERFGFVWTHHMLVLDGWSVPIVLADVLQRYRSLAAGRPMPPEPPPFREYIAWLQRQNLEAAERYWADNLGTPGWSSRPGPLLRPVPDDEAVLVDERIITMTPDETAVVRSAAAAMRVTLNTLVQAAWAFVLQRYTGATDVLFGCTTSSRPSELPGVELMVGSFINTLPVRVQIPDDVPLAEWLPAVQASYAAARRYEYSPLSQIKRWAAVPGLQPLFHSVVVLDNYPTDVDLGELGGLAFRSASAFEKTSEPLTLMVTLDPSITLRLLFHSRRLAPEVAAELAELMRRCLLAVATLERTAEVARLPVAGGAEIGRWSDATAHEFPDGGRTVVDLLRRQASRSPARVAVSADQGMLTYHELIERAERVASAAAAQGAAPGAVVGLCAERSLEMVVGLVGILLAGAAYVPLEPALPQARLASMLADGSVGLVLASRACAQAAAGAAVAATGRDHREDSGQGRDRDPVCVLVIEELADRDKRDEPDRARYPGADHPVRPQDPAYVIFTSGSTGRPKGVCVSHAAIVNRLLWMQDTFVLGPGDRVLQKTPFGFDVSVWEFLWPLICGAQLVMAAPGRHQDPAYLARVIAAQEVTTVHFVPSMLQLFLDEPGAAVLPTLRTVVCSGEALPHALMERCLKVLSGAGLYNLYGPTEAAVDVTWWDCSRPAAPGVVPIGHPVANTQTHVLDRRLQEAPIGVPGELYLGGVQLAAGYINRPALSAERFVAHPLAGGGGRLYRTGDQVCRLADGGLQFLGRLDQQVKIRGQRIELGEVEHVLGEAAGVREAVVVARSAGGGAQLAGYVVADEGLDPGAVRDHARRLLPASAVPASITVVDALPLTHNGKLDRAALEAVARAPDPDPTAGLRGQPSTPLELAITEAFVQVLGRVDVDVTTSFFDLGGDSLSAVRAVRLIEGATMRLLAAHPSARELAMALRAATGGWRAGGPLVRLTRPRDERHTLICVPYGGGSAVSYQPLARELSADTALLAVSLPGHELGESAPFVAVEELAEQCVRVIERDITGPVSVYGHCLGVALATEIARRLEEIGRPVTRLFLAGSFPFYELGRVGRLLTSGRRSGPAADLAKLRYLQSLGGFSELVEEGELAFVMRAFRHDDAAARRYFTSRWREGRALALAAPITCVVGTSDPETPDYGKGHRQWARFGSSVSLAEVPDGGHYFLRQQAQVLAGVIERQIDLAVLVARP
jgi:amino acid adenylation domain-containing protein